MFWSLTMLVSVTGVWGKPQRQARGLQSTFPVLSTAQRDPRVPQIKMLLLREMGKPGMVVHACNPRVRSGDRQVGSLANQPAY